MRRPGRTNADRQPLASVHTAWMLNLGRLVLFHVKLGPAYLPSRLLTIESASAVLRDDFVGAISLMWPKLLP
jgi:hypothetical protein